jgi:predicted TIM-barrel fold metal-dependent hydrolase
MFACIPTQDPDAAAAELERAVSELGAVGVMVNGYTNIGDNQTGRYLDHPSFAPLWSTLAELDVPLYLHPREPLPSQTLIYDGYPSLVGSAWGFGHETATHAKLGGRRSRSYVQGSGVRDRDGRRVVAR